MGWDKTGAEADATPGGQGAHRTTHTLQQPQSTTEQRDRTTARRLQQAATSRLHPWRLLSSAFSSSSSGGVSVPSRPRAAVADPHPPPTSVPSHAHKFHCAEPVLMEARSTPPAYPLGYPTRGAIYASATPPHKDPKKGLVQLMYTFRRVLIFCPVCPEDLPRRGPMGAAAAAGTGLRDIRPGHSRSHTPAVALSFACPRFHHSP
jgi:hypothetical protein